MMPVGTGAGGGAEHILHLLDRKLSEHGIRSLVIAAEGSQLEGELIPSPAAQGEITDSVRAKAQKAHQERIDSALSENHIDLIHFHGLDLDAYRVPADRVRQLGTLHLPIDWYPNDLFGRTDILMNCVSESQADSTDVSRRLPVISNGIDLENLHPSRSKESYLIWLGRICPEKGAHVALRVAHRLELPMIVAGPVHPFDSHLKYFAEEVQPLLDEKRVYIGPVDAIQKRDSLANARCLLVPSLVAETSSLVSMEAIGSGTPVVAFRAGALPEIVDHGVTGFIADSEDAMVDAVLRSDEISPETCRSVAEQRFAASRMVSEYLCLYSRVMNGCHAG